MLTYLHLENFRAFGEPTHIPLAPITLLFGENSAGKTSILHALALLKQTRLQGDHGRHLVWKDDKGGFDLGSFSELMHDHDVDRRLRIGLGFAENAFYGFADNRVDFEPAPMGLEWTFLRDAELKRVFLEELALDIGGSPGVRAIFERDGEDPEDPDPMFDHLLWFSRFEGPKSAFEAEAAAWRTAMPRLMKSAKTIAQLPVDGGPENWPEQAQAFLRDWDVTWDTKQLEARLGTIWRKLMSLDGRSEGLGFSVNLFSFSGPFERYFLGVRVAELEAERRYKLPPFERPVVIHRSLYRADEHIHGAGHRYNLFIDALTPIGPHRVRPPRIIDDDGASPDSVGADGRWTANILMRDANVLKRVNADLEALQVGYELKIERLDRVRRTGIAELRLVDNRRKRAKSVSLSDVGYGIGQLLPILVELASKQERILTIEQPELHIHPRLQAEIGTVFVNAIQRRKQMLVETHSEHLILRLRRLVREGKLKPEDLCVLYVSRGKRGSVVDRIHIDERGDFLDEWPGGFFPERLNELL